MIALFLGWLILMNPTHADVKMEKVEYRDGDVVLEGLVAYDGKKAAKRPGILVVHEWTGINSYTQARIQKLAELGYTAFAADIYGKGVRPTQPKDAATTAAIYKNNRALFRRRVNLALEQLKKHKTVIADKTAAISYCFGGTAVLELARSGAGTRGVVSFHGGLDTPTPQDARNIKGKVLVFHGAEDQVVSSQQVSDFENEMRTAGVNWELVKYAKAVHSFTNPDNASAYNAEADRRSWLAMQNFFNEIFAP